MFRNLKRVDTWPRFDGLGQKGSRPHRLETEIEVQQNITSPSNPSGAKRCGRGPAVKASAKVPRPHPDRANAGIRHGDVAWYQPLRLPLARIEAGATVVELITAPVRQQERGLPLADTGEFPREIGEVIGDKGTTLSGAILE